VDLEGKWKAILIGGGISGLASLVPVLHLACCLIPLLGAILAVGVYANSLPRPPLANQDGLVLGAMTGLIGTAVYAVLIIPLTFLMGNIVGGVLNQIIPSPAEMPSGLRPILQSLLDHFGSVLSVIVILKVLGQLVIFVLFGSLGGILGVALFRPRTASS
jgi:hypothetical protein